MHDEARFPDKELEAHFATAVERLAAGDPFDTILDDVPTIYRTEIADALAVVEATHQLRIAAVPQPAADVRARNKAQFLASAAQMRSEQEAVAGAREDVVAPLAWWRNLSTQTVAMFDKLRMPGGYGSQMWQPAIMFVATIAIVVGVFGLFSAAQASVPGEAYYQFKEMVRAAQLALAPKEAKSDIKARHEEKIRKEALEAAKKATLRNSVYEDSSTLTYHGFNNSRYRIGEFLVAPRYQPDPSVEIFKDMEITGELEPGVQVKLTFRILPWQSESVATPLVQGVALVVIAPPLASKDTPASTVTTDEKCGNVVPDGWVEYTVKSGDTLTDMALRSGVTEIRLRGPNCLPSTKIIAGEVIRVPASAIPPAPIQPAPAQRPPASPTRGRPVAPPSATNTPRPIPTVAATADATTPEATDITPAASATAQTPDATGTVASTSSPESTATPDKTSTPAGTETSPSATPMPTDDPETTPEAPTTPEVTEAPTEAPTVAPTGDATDEPEAPATPAPTGDPELTPEPTEAPTEAPTGEPTPVATAEPTVEATLEVTVEPTTAPTIAPTSEPTAAPTSEPTTAATVAPSTQPPTNSPIPPTPVPPTSVPPTSVPPTSIPPTPVPPTSVPPTSVPPTSVPPTSVPPTSVPPAPAPPAPEPPAPEPPAPEPPAPEPPAPEPPAPEPPPAASP